MEHNDNDIAYVKVKSAFKGVNNMAKLPPYPATIIGMVPMLHIEISYSKKGGG